MDIKKENQNQDVFITNTGKMYWKGKPFGRLTFLDTILYLHKEKWWFDLILSIILSSVTAILVTIARYK